MTDNSEKNITKDITLEKGAEIFLSHLSGKNRSILTIQAYSSDINYFIKWIHENNISATQVSDVVKEDITEYLSYLGQKGLTGVSRARKLAAIREYFRFLEGLGYIQRSPAATVETPKRERNSRNYLYPHEYTKILSVAGSNPRDYAILQVFLQTGIRVSELVKITLDDIDLTSHSLKVKGKGKVERSIELEKKGIQAIKNWLQVRPQVTDITDISISGDIDNINSNINSSNTNSYLFLNKDGQALSERGVRKLVKKYCKLAEITKNISCHSFRHTFGTYKAEKGVSPFQLQQWLGHARLDTTQIYVHMARQNARKVMENTSL